MSGPELSGYVIVSGMPGAGKSTVTSLAAGLLPRAAQVKGDDVNQMIVSGGVMFMGTPRDEALRQHELCKRNMCALAAPRPAQPQPTSASITTPPARMRSMRLKRRSAGELRGGSRAEPCVEDDRTRS